METLSVIVPILIALCVILTPIGLVAAIILAIASREESDKNKKKKLSRYALWSGVGPIVILFLILSLWGFVRILIETVASTS